MKANQLTVCLVVLLALPAMPGFAEVPAQERTLVTDPVALESLGFPFDARHVYMRTARAALAEESRDFGSASVHFTGVSPKAFQGRQDILGSWQYHGGAVACCENLTAVGTEQFADAQIDLPTGADLDGVRWWAVDANPAADLAVVVLEHCLPSFTAGGSTTTILGSSSTTGSSGVQSGFISIGPHTVSNRDCVYLVRVRFDDTSGLTLQKVRAQWRRQISPAPAAATFIDVPTSHVFFPWIEALAAAGITTGCNLSPPLYCPDDPVTRGQMAVFISRALGLFFP